MQEIIKGTSGNLLITAHEADNAVRVQAQDIVGSLASTGTAIRFDRPRTYGLTTAETGNITLDPADAKSGIVQLIRHNAGSEPTFGSQFIKMSSYSYTPSVVNYIYLEYISSTEILVTASKAA